MGQGFSLSTPSAGVAGVAGIGVPELSDLLYEKSLGDARFMKSVRARHQDGLALVKMLVKPYTVNLDKYKKEILRHGKELSGVPNALPFEQVVETDTNGYLVRQYIYSSLYDRLSTRPFLDDVEKKWLAFQLLCALRDCHARDIYHGDIKAQNVLVTSWNWLYLSDFSSAYKPAMLPEDLPADFSYYFDTSGRRTCYVAPERFYASGRPPPEDARVTAAMDVFSAGCVIAQMFLETEIFSLALLFSYKQGKYDPVSTHLSRIADKDLRDLIAHMIQPDPEARFSAEHYLGAWRGRVFPDYFYHFLHGYMDHITDPTAGASPASGATSRNLGEPDERIDRIYNDFDKIMYFLGHHRNDGQPDAAAAAAATAAAAAAVAVASVTAKPTHARLGLGHFPVRLSIPNHEHYVSDNAMEPPEDDGTLIFLAVVLSSLRNTVRAASRIRGCDVLLGFSERLTDEAKLDRVLPYLVALLGDESEMVVIAAIRSITQLLRLVRVVTPINSHIFPDYIMPRLEAVLREKGAGPRSPLVRATYASCLGSLALTALRFLEATGGLLANGLLTFTDPEVELVPDAAGAPDGLGDSARRQLANVLETHTKALVEDPDVHVRRAFLASVPELCVFFAARSNDVLLSHLNTYLNDPDWMLKCAFFETIVGISTLLGSVSVEEFILPLMLQALTDPEEFVVREVLHSLAQLAALGLFSRTRLWELVDLAVRLTMHPNAWIREAAAEFLAASALFLSPADVQCMVMPIVRPFFKPSMAPRFTELDLLDALKKPLARTVFDHTVLWAQKTDTSPFWKPFEQFRAFAARSSARFMGGASSAAAAAGRDADLGSLVRTEEDEQWLARLRKLGLGPGDEFKLVALREFIWRVGMRRSREGPEGGDPTPSLQTPPPRHNELISLKSLGITPQTVLLYQEPQKDVGAADARGADSRGADARAAKAPYTIADALLDASMTADDPASKRRLAAALHAPSRVRGSDSTGAASPGTPAASLAVSPTETRATGSRASSVAGAGAGEEEPYANRRPIRHRSSVLSLLDRKDNNKTPAETATTSENAFGRVAGTLSPPLQPQHPPPPFSFPQSQPPPPDAPTPCKESCARARHSYEGHDPSILKMLDAISLETHPVDISDFGLPVTPVTGQRMVAPAGGQQGKPQPWQPRGTLVATFAEHHGAINRVVASPDHLFFVTGGHDGTVRVWDSARLERNITHRSRQVYRHAPGTSVVALCFVENTHTFISCGSDGTVHLVRVDTSVSASGGAVRYGRLRQVRRFDVGVPGEHATWVEHFKTESHSVMMLATNLSRLLAIDLRTMETLYELRNPVHHGIPTCFCIDRRRHWLCVGTSHGILDLWDLRFRMRVRGWGLPGRSAIFRLSVHPAKGRGRWVCVAGGAGPGEVTTWDLEKEVCREIFRPAGAGGGGVPKNYDAWDVDADKPEDMLARFATANIEPSSPPSSSDPTGADRGVRALLIGTAASEIAAAAAAAASSSDAALRASDIRGPYIITGGTDKKLRFWDLHRAGNSLTFSGLQPDDPRPSYTSSTPTGMLTVFSERLPRMSTSGGGSRRATITGGGGGGGGGDGRVDSRDGKSPVPPGRPSRSTVVSVQQQALMRGHLDAVLDVVVLEVPYTVVVSVDRLGVVFVFQ